MSAKVLGRTNCEFPGVWLRLLPGPSAPSSASLDDFVNAAMAAQTPLDISGSPGLWGGVLRGEETSTLMQVSSTDYERATSSAHAADLVQAHLLETLSSVGRDCIDFYFLRSRARMDESKFSGALEAIELGRQAGHIRFIGLFAEGGEEATLANWHLHDAFEVVSLSGGAETLRAVAKERRVGVLERLSTVLDRADERSGAALAPVRTAGEIARALENAT